MTGLSHLAPVPMVVLIILLAVDAWIYADAMERVRQGRPVSVALGSLRLQTPAAWLLGCLTLWVVFVPLYLTLTGRNPFARGSG